ncbi:hypothetical protein Tco_0968340 [Tanacetum coccineum]
MGDKNSIRTFGDYYKPSYEGYRNTIELPVGNNVVPIRSDTIWLVQNGCSFHELRSEDLNQHLKDFLKLVDSLDLDGENKERMRLRLFQFSLRGQASNWLERLPSRSITTCTSDRRLIELENQVQRLMEAHLALTQPTQVKKITTSCEICSGPHDTQYYIEDPEQAFVEYVSLRTDEAGGILSSQSKTILVTPIIHHGGVTQTLGLVSNFMASQDARLSKFEADFKQQQSEMTNKIDIVLKVITNQISGTLPSDIVKNPKLSSINAITIHSEKQSDSYDKEKENEEEGKDSPENIHVNPSTPPDLSVAFITEKVLKFNSFLESLGLVLQSFDTEVVCTKGDDGKKWVRVHSRRNAKENKGSWIIHLAL